MPEGDTVYLAAKRMAAALSGKRLTRGELQARAASAAAVQYGRLTQVPASDAVTTHLFSQLAELNELAGWCCFDSGMDLHARWHYRTAVDLAHRVHDNYRMASAMRFMGIVDAVRGAEGRDAPYLGHLGESDGTA